MLVSSKREDQKRRGLKFHGKVLIKVPGSGILTDQAVIRIYVIIPWITVEVVAV